MANSGERVRVALAVYKENQMKNNLRVSVKKIKIFKEVTILNM